MIATSDEDAIERATAVPRIAAVKDAHATRSPDIRQRGGGNPL
jgi:hypothetical protein